MAATSYTKRYRKPEVRPTPIPEADVVSIRDIRYRIDIDTWPKLSRLKLSNQVLLAISLPLRWNPDRELFEPGYGATVDLSAIGGTTVTKDEIVGALKALIDDSIKGVLRSIGDAGDSPSNATGGTLLYYAYDIRARMYDIRRALGIQHQTLITTSTPLDANATYVSSSWDLLDVKCGYIFASAYADVDGVLAIEQSWDGTNWDFRDEQALTGPGTAYLKVPIKARYVRVVYENGSTAQSVFRLGRGVVIA